MARADVPHFSLPFRFTNGQAAVNEQDTIDDIADCVEAVLRTPVGSRPEHPLFGIPDQVFQQRPLDVDDIARRVEAWEPRAKVLLEEDSDRFDAAIAEVKATLNEQE